MANTLDAVIPRILAQGLLALRSNSIMPRLINTDYDSDAQRLGTSVDVPKPPSIAVTDVSPSNTEPTTAGTTPTFVPIVLDQWKEAAFFLTDKDMKQAMEGIIPMQASAAIGALADEIDKYILSKYVDFYGWVGTAGTTPFASTADANNASKVLNKQLAPRSQRRFVIDPDAEANALELRAFQDVSFSGDEFGIEEGMINRKLGFDFFMDQNVPTHDTKAAGTIAINKTTGYAVGATQVEVDGVTTSPAVGDIFTFAGDDQTYVVKGYSGNVITFDPGLKVAVIDDAALTFKADHVVNLAFHRDAIAFATRPLLDEGVGMGNIMASTVDPVSGLTLRLEVTREHKRLRFSYDCLYGAAVIRPELGCRVAG